jgi:CRISPR-associated endonuclease/helicase Cas3
MSFRVPVDLTNSGHFFACCGLFELASRLDADALAHFKGAEFLVETTVSFEETIRSLINARVRELDDEDQTASPLRLDPMGLILDWWKDEHTGGQELKVWAGTMEAPRIFRAMVHALATKQPSAAQALDFACVVYQPGTDKKVEPFYFDSRRAQNAHSRDVGFSANDLGLTTLAFPAVEALCLVGLQRARPAETGIRRVFEYRAWSDPIPINLVGAATGGFVPAEGPAFRFESWFRTGQKKHKAFRAAVRIEKEKANEAR